MKPTLTRRYRRRSTPARSEGAFFKKESQESFFGNTEHGSFFQPAVTTAPAQNIHRTFEGGNKLQRAEDKKEEDKKIMKKEDKKEEEKIMKTEDKKEEEKVQKKEAGALPVPGNTVNNYIGSLNGKGNPLPAQSNQFFSSKMDFDFSDVKIHADKEAAESAKGVNAKAYTVGNNIVFNEGQCNFETAEGKKLMAHELTHVIQQRSIIPGKIQRTPDSVSDKISEEDKNIIAAIVATEAFPGQEEDMEWVYIHLYNKSNLDQSTPYKKKKDTYKFNKFLLDGLYKDDQLRGEHFIEECKNLLGPKKAGLCDGLKKIKDVYELNKDYYDKHDKLRVGRIKSELIDKFNRQSESPGYTSNGNLDDLNRDDGEWPMIRQYLIMQDADSKLDNLIKKLGTGSRFEIVYKKEKIVDFFKKNPKKLPKKVSKYP